MRFFNLAALALAIPAALVSAQVDQVPELGIVTTFPNNPFSIVQNGQENTVVLSITNSPKADRVLTLHSITGAFLNLNKEDGQKGRVVRNMTTTTYKNRPLRSVGGKPVQVPFKFVPEFKPQEMGVEFRIIVNDEQTGKKYNIQAYRGKVQVEEPPKNWFDLQLLSLYAMFIGGIGATAYFTLFSGGGKRKGGSKKVDAPSVTTSVSAKASGAGGDEASYDEDWIPEQHLKSRKTRSSAANALSSGDEEPSSPKRKGKGRK
ncbi:hypothetical protein IE53DRAFT_386578 [Violaceomyces palustris]|uniref:Uncharacterized protein n=1 Tax=Violaceomyces palustris TaxID=1673888 RepID=A0ACD0NZ39_9BASI|nr:hypothetical protein IE53DRAFT_386578 [Violaceomyces palustris]